jgi:hypothetical protein
VTHSTEQEGFDDQGRQLFSPEVDFKGFANAVPIAPGGGSAPAAAGSTPAGFPRPANSSTAAGSTMLNNTTSLENLVDRPITLASAGIVERREHGLVVLSPAEGRPWRRVLYVNSYGGAQGWEKIKKGQWAPHHLWGCQELVRMGYEVALAEPLPHFYLYRNPLPHDLKLLGIVRDWLGPDDIIYSGHTLLYWLPLLRRIGAIRSRVVSLCFAREELDMSRAHDGIIALTPTAADHARKLAPKAKVAHLAWGADLRSFPKLHYRPNWFLSCGLTNRDHQTLSRAAARTQRRIRVVTADGAPGVSWTSNVELVVGGIHDKTLSYGEFLNRQYGGSAACMIIVKDDPTDYTANGFTNLIEVMCMGRPVILTRTGALRSEIDVEKAGCGLYVPPGNPGALAKAINVLASDPQMAQSMGQRGRKLAEERYDINRYAGDLHRFFDSL